MMKTTDDVEDRIEHAKRGLEEKLSELQRRVDHTKQVLSPDHYLQNPWVRFGLGFAGGFVAGRLASFVPVGAVVKKLAVFGASALLREAFAEWQRQSRGAAPAIFESSDPFPTART